MPIEVKFNVGKSSNIQTSTNGPMASIIVEPNQIEFLMHTRRDNIKEEILFDFDFKFEEL